MPSVKEMQRRMRNESRQNPGIDRRDDGIIFARKNQSWLAEPVQPGNAGPAHTCQQLHEVSPAIWRFAQLRRTASLFCILSKRVTIEERRHGGKIKRAARTEHFAQDTQFSGN